MGRRAAPPPAAAPRVTPPRAERSSAARQQRSAAPRRAAAPLPPRRPLFSLQSPFLPPLSVLSAASPLVTRRALTAARLILVGARAGRRQAPAAFRPSFRARHRRPRPFFSRRCTALPPVCSAASAAARRARPLCARAAPRRAASRPGGHFWLSGPLLPAPLSLSVPPKPPLPSTDAPPSAPLHSPPFCIWRAVLVGVERVCWAFFVPPLSFVLVV